MICFPKCKMLACSTSGAWTVDIVWSYLCRATYSMTSRFYVRRGFNRHPINRIRKMGEVPESEVIMLHWEEVVTCHPALSQSIFCALGCRVCCYLDLASNDLASASFGLHLHQEHLRYCLLSLWRSGLGQDTETASGNGGRSLTTGGTAAPTGTMTSVMTGLSREEEGKLQRSKRVGRQQKT